MDLEYIPLLQVQRELQGIPRNHARFQIGNNRGRINGWVGASGIFGSCIRFE